jgi:hypothetical protein
MSATFDSVLSDLVRVCEISSEMKNVALAAVVRDLKGCVRLVIRPEKDKSVDPSKLESAINDVLGHYFKTPIMMTDDWPPRYWIEPRLGRPSMRM